MKKNNFSLFLLSLVPLAYIIKGALPVDLTLIVYVLLYVIAIYKILVKKEGISFSKVDILFYAWTLMLLIGTFYSPVQSEALIKSMKFIFLAVSLIFFTRLFIKNKSDLNRFIFYLLINSTLTGYLVLIDFVASGMETFRYQAFGSVVPIPLSMLGATTLLVSVFMFYYKRINLITFILTAFPSISVMTIAASKGPVVSFLITLALMMPILFKRIKVGYVLLSTISIYLLTKIGFVKDSLDTLLRRFERAEYDMSTSIRLNSYDESIETFKNNPIFGIGTAGNYPDYPHNFLLEVLSENGVVLVIFISCLFILLVYQYVRFLFKKEINPAETIILALIICSLSSLMFSFTYVDHKYLFLSIGLLLTYNKVRSYDSTNEVVEEKPKTSKRRIFKRYKIVW